MVVCVMVLLFSLFLWSLCLSLSLPPILFCQAEDDLVLLAAIPLAVLDSTLCWWISYVSPLLFVCVPLSLLMGCVTVALRMWDVGHPSFCPPLRFLSFSVQGQTCARLQSGRLYSSLNFLFHVFFFFFFFTAK